MADFLGGLLGNLGGETGQSGSDTGGSASGFDLSKVLNVENNTTYEETGYSDHQSSAQDSSIIDNGSNESVSYTSNADNGDDGSSNVSYESSSEDLGGSQSDSSEASHNVDYSSVSFTNEFSLETSLDALTQSVNHDGGGLLGAG